MKKEKDVVGIKNDEIDLEIDNHVSKKIIEDNEERTNKIKKHKYFFLRKINENAHNLLLSSLAFIVVFIISIVVSIIYINKVSEYNNLLLNDQYNPILDSELNSLANTINVLQVFNLILLIVNFIIICINYVFVTKILTNSVNLQKNDDSKHSWSLFIISFVLVLIGMIPLIPIMLAYALKQTTYYAFKDID